MKFLLMTLDLEKFRFMSVNSRRNDPRISMMRIRLKVKLKKSGIASQRCYVKSGEMTYLVQ